MEQLLLALYVVLSVGIVALILLQQGKGADIGASFGAGASQTVFGSAGAGNALTRGTAILATLFFLASVGLAVLAKHKAEAAREGGVPVPVAAETRDNVVQPAPGDLPAPPAATAPASDAAAPASDIPAASQQIPEDSPAVSSEAPAGDIPAGQ
jgi:preprotein translocase subunit SecG